MLSRSEERGIITEKVFMDSASGIFFEELTANPADLLFELTRPEYATRKTMSPATAEFLRNQQALRLEGNIASLRKKQEEFNRKMEEYIQSLRSLINSLTPPADGVAKSRPGGTHVSCLGCGSIKVFSDIQVISSLGLPVSVPRPLELIVATGETIKKGIFHCPTCGNSHLIVRPL